MSTNTTNNYRFKKSVLYRQILNNNGKQLNNIIADMLELGQRCFDQWVAGDDNAEDGERILQKFQKIDRTLVDMQKCIMNTLKYSTLTHDILEDRVELKNKPPNCECNTKISQLQERIATDKEKLEMFLTETTILTQEKLNLQKRNAKLQKILQNKEEDIINQHEILFEYRKQKLSDGDKELDDLRCSLRKDVTNLKDELRTINLENYNLRQQLLKTPENYNHQQLIIEIEKYQDKIKKLEQTLKEQKDDFCKVSKENDNLQWELTLLLKQNDCKQKENEYQKNINTLEECLSYFLQRNSELKQRLNINDEDSSIIIRQRRTQTGKTYQTQKLTEEGNLFEGSSSNIFGKKDAVKNDSCARNHEDIVDCVNISRENNCKEEAENCGFVVCPGQRKIIGNKEEAD